MNTKPVQIKRQILNALLTVLILLSIQAIVYADQPSSSTQGGRPAGSYDLSDFDNVNLFNGNLNFRLPLLTVGGRGEASFTIAFGMENKWTTGVGYDGQCPSYYYVPNGGRRVNASFGELGDASSTYDYVEAGEYSCTNDFYQPTRAVFAPTFVTADGTTYVFHSVANSGAPIQIPAGCGFVAGTNLGKVFITWDGSGMKLVADYDLYYNGYSTTMRTSPNGASLPQAWTVLFPNGTRYRIEPNGTKWLEDRNGNRITFYYGMHAQTYYGVKQIVDSAGRVVNIDYLQNEAPYGLHTKITYKGFGGATRIIRVGELQVWLPDGRTYGFTYNSNSELTRVVLPTGGAYEYDWGGNIPPPSQPCQPPNDVAFRYVAERRVYSDGTNLSGRMTFSAPNGMTQVDTYDASNNLLARSRHYFHGDPKPPMPPDNPHWTYGSEQENLNALKGKEYRTEAYAADGTPLRVNESTWVTPRQVTWSMYGEPSQTINVNARVEVSQIALTDVSPNLVTKTEYLYNQGQWANTFFNVLTDTFQYDYGQGTPGALLNRSHSEYISYDNGNYQNQLYIPLLPSEIWISSDSNGNSKGSLLRYEYDNYASDTNHAPLVDRQSIIGHNSNSGTGYTLRGNATKVTSYANAQNQTGEVSVYSQYDIAGNVIKRIDARGCATTIDFSDRFGAPDGDARQNSGSTELNSASQYSYAFPTLVTNCLGHTAYTQFDFYLGQPVDSEDANGVISSGYFNDSLDRPTRIKLSVGTSVEKQRSFSYDDVNHIITTTSDLNTNNDGALVAKVLYDGLGRTIETRQYEGGTNYIAAQQQYDALGRAYRSSNPFRPWQSESAIWTTTGFDALSRVTSVTTPDSAMITSFYSGNTVTVTDQAGKARKSVTDALGRLTQIYEDPSGLNYQTNYSYDVLGNLTTAAQGVQTRTFVYDSLKRLTSATNPESGTISYAYDNNGNLLTRLDARNITTTFVYDALDRPTSKSYNDNPQTPAVNYFYDSQTLPAGAPSFDRGSATGRLVAVTYGGSSAGTYRGYDAMGRVIRQYQQTDSVNYLVEASYYANSSLQNQTYPSVPSYGDRRVVSYTNDSAGRLASLNSSATTYAPAASVSSIGYASHNALNTETYGNSLVHAITYNNRLQANEIKLGTSGAPTSVVDLVYSYGTTNNNGNVQNVTYAGGGLSYTQTFGYDSLNRLTTSVESGSSWSQTNGYDQYGNRWIDYGGGNHNLSFSTSTNRITTSGFSYDSAGNLTNDTIHAYTFDAENKIRTVDTASAYTYDGEGQRVRKLVGENLRFVYDMHGKQIAEFDGGNGSLKKEYIYGASALVATIEPTSVNSNGTRYTTSDNLGSPRVVTNSGGNVVSRHDYMPFGGEIGLIGGRTSGIGYGVADGERQKFTLKERDNETGLDFFGERYYASTQGRFISVDPLGASAIVADPQSFNRYTYVLNNPLKYVDPDGLDAKNPWADLTDEERKLLASKLTTVTGKNQTAAAQDAFNTMIRYGTKTDEQVANKVASVQNFVASLGHDERVWGQITSITTVSTSADGKQSDVGFTIKDQKGFTDAVTAMKDPATGLQRFAWLGDHDWGDHKDSIREMAQDTGAASMHLESTNGARTTEAAHWDVSSSFTENTWGNIFKDSIPIYGEGRHINAGVRHLREGRATTAAVRQELKNKNLVPR